MVPEIGAFPDCGTNIFQEIFCLSTSDRGRPAVLTKETYLVYIYRVNIWGDKSLSLEIVGADARKCP